MGGFSEEVLEVECCFGEELGDGGFEIKDGFVIVRKVVFVKFKRILPLGKGGDKMWVVECKISLLFRSVFIEEETNLFCVWEGIGGSGGDRACGRRDGRGFLGDILP